MSMSHKQVLYESDSAMQVGVQKGAQEHACGDVFPLHTCFAALQARRPGKSAIVASYKMLQSQSGDITFRSDQEVGA